MERVGEWYCWYFRVSKTTTKHTKDLFVISPNTGIGSTQDVLYHRSPSCLPGTGWDSLGWPVTFTHGQQSSRNLLDMHRCVKYTLHCTPGFALWISNGNIEPHHWDNFLNNRMRFSCNCGVWDWKIWWWNLRMFQAVPIYCSVFLNRNTNKIFYHWNALI